jgi:hypothetical protein
MKRLDASISINRAFHQNLLPLKKEVLRGGMKALIVLKKDSISERDERVEILAGLNCADVSVTKVLKGCTKQRKSYDQTGKLHSILLLRMKQRRRYRKRKVAFVIEHHSRRQSSNSSNSSHLMLVGNSEANPDYTRISELKYVNENSGAQSTSPHTLPNSFSKKFTTLNLKFCSVH